MGMAAGNVRILILVEQPHVSEAVEHNLCEAIRTKTLEFEIALSAARSRQKKWVDEHFDFVGV